ncbi:MAG: hypothetical protein J6H21_00195 [Firmicutes bacterium]|nr:hypothetical protein [Bacillota bacterium]
MEPNEAITTNETNTTSERKPVFRKETIDRISSPEQLTDYLKVTNPGTWVLLSIVLLLLVSLVAWSFIGTLETSVDVKVAVSDHMAEVISLDGSPLEEGMPLKVSGQEALLASSGSDEYGRTYGVAEVMLPDGTYDGTVVIETIRPLDFLLESR